MNKMSDSELYYAYMMYGQAGELGAISPPSENLNDLLADRAIKDWLKNFKPTQWTLKTKVIETTTNSSGEEETYESFA